MPGERNLITKLLVCINLAVLACLVWLLCVGLSSKASHPVDGKTGSYSSADSKNATDHNIHANDAQQVDADLAALRTEAGCLVAAKARARYEKIGKDEFLRKMSEIKLPSTQKEYAAFAAKLGLSVEARENLFTRLTELDTQTRIPVQMSKEDRVLLGLPKEYIFDECEVLTELRSLLGEPNYAQFVAYRETIPARRFVGEYEQQLTITNQPLADAQREALVAAMNSVSKEKYPSFSDPKEVRAAFFDAQLKRYEEVLRSTRSTLTTEQHAALERALLGKIEAGLRGYQIQDVQRAVEKSGSETK